MAGSAAGYPRTVRVLITNDDGIDSAGLRALASVAHVAGHQVAVAAPSWDASGASASLTAVEEGGRLLVEERDLVGLPGVCFYAVEAAPAFIVRAAAVGVFGTPPEIVLSGINRGPNLGHAVLHSGTVGAALTASTFGLPSMAVSIGTGSEVHWETACHVAGLALDALIRSGRPTALNVNVPNVHLDDLKSFEEARLASFGAIQTTITEQGAGYVKLGYEPMERDAEPGTDVAAYHDGIACYTPLIACCEDDDAPRLDMPTKLRHTRPLARR